MFRISLITVHAIGVFTLLIIVYACSPRTPDPLGQQWMGRDGQRWNIIAIRQPNSNRFDLRWVDRTQPERVLNGELKVTVHEDKIKLYKHVGESSYHCDGLLSGDRRFISGVCFSTLAGGQVVLPDHSWWATIENNQNSRGAGKLNLNEATVASMEQRLQLDADQARNVVDYKLNAGHIAAVDDLHRYGVLPAEVVERIRPEVTLQ